MSLPSENKPDLNLKPLTESMVLVVNSPSFKYGEFVPARFTCDGENINPAIVIENVPPQTKSVSLILEDRTDQTSTVAHWVLWNISPSLGRIAENSTAGERGMNDFGNDGYRGPCPKDGRHEYHFTVYALDVLLSLKPGSGKEAVLQAIEGHILAAGDLVGLVESGLPK